MAIYISVLSTFFYLDKENVDIEGYGNKHSQCNVGYAIFYVKKRVVKITLHSNIVQIYKIPHMAHLLSQTTNVLAICILVRIIALLLCPLARAALPYLHQ